MENLSFELCFTIKENLKALSKKIELSSISTEYLNLSPKVYNALGRSGITNFQHISESIILIYKGEIKYLNGNDSREIFQKIIDIFETINTYKKFRPFSINETIIKKSLEKPIDMIYHSQNYDQKQNNYINNIIELVKTLYSLSCVKNEIDLEDGEEPIFLPQLDNKIFKEEYGGGEQNQTNKYELIQKDIEEIFSKMTDREFEVIRARGSFANSKKRTLQEISEEFGVTRERIRQIEQKVSIKIKRAVSLSRKSYLFEFLYEKVKQNNDLTEKKELVEELQGVLRETEFSAEEIINFLSLSFKNEIFNKNKDRKLVYLEELDVFINEKENKSTIILLSEEIQNILVRTLSPLSWHELFEKLSNEINAVKISENSAFKILNCLANSGLVKAVNDKWVISEKRKLTRVEKMKLVMNELGKPAHFSEITKSYNKHFPDDHKTQHNIHAVLNIYDDFVLVGRGKYGLADWGLHNDGNVANAVRRILASKKRQMSLQEIEYEVRKTWDVQNLTVQAAIAMDARFKKTKEGLIELTEYGKKTEKRQKRDDEERLDRIIEIFEYVKKPCSVKKIVDMHNHINADKPLKVNAVKYLLLRKPDIFMKVSADEFALVDWEYESYVEPENSREALILDIIHKFGPLKLKEITNIYNQQTSEEKISENSVGNTIKKLSKKVESTQNHFYKIKSNFIMANLSDLTENRKELITKISNILESIGAPSHIDYIFSVYQNHYPQDNLAIEEIDRILKTNRDKFQKISDKVYVVNSNLI